MSIEERTIGQLRRLSSSKEDTRGSVETACCRLGEVSPWSAQWMLQGCQTDHACRGSDEWDLYRQPPIFAWSGRPIVCVKNPGLGYGLESSGLAGLSVVPQRCGKHIRSPGV